MTRRLKKKKGFSADLSWCLMTLIYIRYSLAASQLASVVISVSVCPSGAQKLFNMFSCIFKGKLRQHVPPQFRHTSRWTSQGATRLRQNTSFIHQWNWKPLKIRSWDWREELCSPASCFSALLNSNDLSHLTAIQTILGMFLVVSLSFDLTRRPNKSCF